MVSETGVPLYRWDNGMASVNQQRAEYCKEYWIAACSIKTSLSSDGPPKGDESPNHAHRRRGIMETRKFCIQRFHFEKYQARVRVVASLHD